MDTRIREFEVHPAALVFDELEGKDFDDLVASVREHGVLEPLVLYDGKILDGRNRLRACVVAGIPSDSINKIHLSIDRDPYAFAWEMNGNRRHMTPARRAEKLLEVQKLSGEWEREREAAREEANRKRAEKMTGIPYAPEGKTRKPQAEEGRGSSEPQPSPPPRQREGKAAKKLAEQAHVSVSTAKRTIARAKAAEAPPAPIGKLESAKQKRIKLARKARGSMWRIPRAVKAMAAVLRERLTSDERRNLARLLMEGDEAAAWTASDLFAALDRAAISREITG